MLGTISYKRRNMDFEKILQKAQQKAQKLADEVSSTLKKADYTLDPDELSIKIADKLFNASEPKKSENKPNIAVPPSFRINYPFIQDIYQKTNLKPGKSHYWFHDSSSKCDLIQISSIDETGMFATPIAAMCIYYRQEILKGAKIVSDYIIENSKFVEFPSNKWVLGQIAQLIDLSLSYILGFKMGYDGNASGNSNCSPDFNYGYEDGLNIRKQFLEEKLIELENDPFENEINPEKLTELYRVGYYWENSNEQIEVGSQEINNDNQN